MAWLQDLWRRIAGRAKVVEPPIPPGSPREVPAEDAKEADAEATGEASLESLCVAIEYVDASGQWSRRRITAYKAELLSDGDWMLRATCHERQALRSFRLSRIQCCISLITGEVFPDARDYFAEFLAVAGVRQARPQSRPAPQPAPESKTAAPDVPVEETAPEPPTRLQRVRAVRAEIDLLLFLARADGRMHRNERAEIVAYVVEADPALAADADWLADYVSRIFPAAQDFLARLNDIAKLPRERKGRLATTIERLIDADGKRHDDEAAMATELAEALRD